MRKRVGVRVMNKRNNVLKSALVLGTGFVGGYLCAKYGKSVLGCIENSFDKKSVEDLANEIKEDMGKNREQVIKTFEKISQKSSNDEDYCYVQKNPRYIKIPVKNSDIEKYKNTNINNDNKEYLDKNSSNNIKNNNAVDVKSEYSENKNKSVSNKSKELSDILNEFKLEAEKELRNRREQLEPKVKEIIEELKNKTDEIEILKTLRDEVLKDEKETKKEEVVEEKKEIENKEEDKKD